MSIDCDETQAHWAWSWPMTWPVLPTFKMVCSRLLKTTTNARHMRRGLRILLGPNLKWRAALYHGTDDNSCALRLITEVFVVYG